MFDIWLGIWKNQPFLLRLLVTASFALLAAGSAMLLFSARQEARDAQADLAVQLAGELETLPAMLSEVAVLGDFSSLRQSLDHFVARPYIVRAEYLDHSGSRLTSEDRVVHKQAPDWFSSAMGFDDISGSAQISIGGRTYGEVKLRLSSRMHAERAWSRLGHHLAILLLAVSLDFVGIWLILRHGLAPLERLQRGSDAIAQGHLETRLAEEGGPELRHLISSFNRMAEATQRAQAGLAQSNRELQRFAEITAHHLQEPARRLATYAERLDNQLAGKLDDAEARISLDFIRQEARRQQNLLRDIERYLAANQPRGAIEQIDANAFLTRLLEKRAADIKAARAKVSIGALPAVWIDAARLADLFGAILDNALQHGGDSSTAAATPLHIQIDGALDGAVLRYAVRDNGPGIEAAYRERVFRVFERLKPGKINTGIGLAIVRRIVESLGGRTWIEGPPAGGCIVLVELPADRATEDTK